MGKSIGTTIKAIKEDTRSLDSRSHASSQELQKIVGRGNPHTFPLYKREGPRQGRATLGTAPIL